MSYMYNCFQKFGTNIRYLNSEIKLIYFILNGYNYCVIVLCLFIYYSRDEKGNTERGNQEKGNGYFEGEARVTLRKREGSSHRRGKGYLAGEGNVTSQEREGSPHRRGKWSPRGGGKCHFAWGGKGHIAGTEGSPGESQRVSRGEGRVTSWEREASSRERVKAGREKGTRDNL